MRRACLISSLFVAAGCTQEVEGGSGFGSGGDAGAQGTAGNGPSGGTAGSDGTAGDGADAASDATSETTSEPASASGEATSDASEGTAGGAESDGGSSSDGATAGGETATGDDGSTPLEYDACGFPLDGPWIQIEYSQAGGSSTSPSWSTSDTPGWGEAQWAASNASWPEVWDLYQNIAVSNDPIGVLAVVGSSAQLQLMLGFEELIDYDDATVCVEGRSVSTSASVTFDAYNPLTGIGNTGTMAHDWNMHATGIELGHCFEPGGGVQAVRLDATGGSAALGVRRMRLVLHGAVY